MVSIACMNSNTQSIASFVNLRVPKKANKGIHPIAAKARRRVMPESFARKPATESKYGDNQMPN